MGALAAAGPARASFVTGIDGVELFTSGDQAQATRWFDTTAELGAGIVRISASWRFIVSGIPSDATDPADPAYDFSELDLAVRDAAARNLRVMITFGSAPDYAQVGGGNPPGDDLPVGVWKPEPQALGDFAEAVATRYSGSFNGLPRVRDFDVWNESNLEGFLAPQYEQGKLVSVDRYRQMTIAVDRGIDSAHADNRVVVGSLAPYGDDPGGFRTRPLIFLRKLLCLDQKLRATKCPNKTPVDILSHHPIDLSGGPRRSAIDDDDVATPDLGRVKRVLRAAERAGTIAGKSKHHPLWVTEFWWESFPERPSAAVPGLQKHGLWIEEALYLFWKAGADAAIYFRLTDEPPDPQAPEGSLQTGLYLADGSPKPAATAFRFPFVTERSSESRIRAWGKSPAAGKVRIELKTKRGWRAVDKETVKAGGVFTADLALKGKAKLRASVAGERSLVWTQGKA